MAFAHIDLRRITRRHPGRGRGAVIVIHGIRPVAAGKHIGIVAAAALEQIRPCATIERVVSQTGIERIVAGHALYEVSPRSPSQRIVARGAEHRHLHRHHIAIGQHE